MASDPVPTDEAQRRAVAVNDLLREIGLAARDQTTWWNHRGCEGLAGRTPRRQA